MKHHSTGVVVELTIVEIKMATNKDDNTGNSNKGSNQGSSGSSSKQSASDSKSSQSHGGNQSGDSSNRGFASMDPEQQREIAAEGGRAAHAAGKTTYVSKGQ